MALAIGQMLKGRHASYYVTKVLKDATVYQAEMVLSTVSSAAQSVPLAAIKCSPAGKSTAQYNREFRCYAIPSIAQSPYIRPLLELIGHDEPPNDTSRQPRCMLSDGSWSYESSFSGMIGFNGVHLLAMVVLIGPNHLILKGLAIRAPEVWKDEGITPKADVWSLGITLAHWMASRAIFGPSDKIIEGMAEAWCLAKMIRLLGPIGDPNPTKTDLVDEFALAEFLEKETFIHPEKGREEKFIKLGTIRHELESVEGPIDKDCINFIESLLVVDHTKRPTAKEALEHPWLQV